MLQLVFLLGAATCVFANLLASLKRNLRDRRQQTQALQTWEGEGGALKESDDVARTVAG
jgi:hypothetical protein